MGHLTGRREKHRVCHAPLILSSPFSWLAADQRPPDTLAILDDGYDPCDRPQFRAFTLRLSHCLGRLALAWSPPSATILTQVRRSDDVDTDKQRPIAAIMQDRHALVAQAEFAPVLRLRRNGQGESPSIGQWHWNLAAEQSSEQINLDIGREIVAGVLELWIGP